FVPAGHDVLDVDDAVLVGHVGPRLVGGVGGLVAIPQVADHELHIGQGLVGNGVVLRDQQALAGVVLNIKLDDAVRVGGNNDLPLMWVGEVIARRRGDLRQFVGAVGQVLKQQFAVLIRFSVAAD